ncbi:MAG TPA: phosphate signaling complex protein PhoU [Candidatus Onthenecus intestinigallinarum]|uniref:Phosphate-specific transport system accessory protein PhoU n=1 Tax=Candidatus Onthenecus intestinigallinarum TaxID=2840875 RepID=A0A9D0Z9Y9_9FIRM|nr:phosphate signaling complex protein PhoU [Candidatus Onthenecus intestinigallinarum]
MRIHFDEQLERLSDLLMEMGGQIERAIDGALEALERRDLDLARTVAKNDEEINRMEQEIESLCLKLLLQQQPVARDLRFISAALKMITDMERIGDQAADICEIVVLLAGEGGQETPADLSHMARTTIRMVTQSLDAFVRRDEALAHAVVAQDDEVDALFAAVRADLIARIRAGRESAEEAIDLMMIAKYLERVGDHATNIAEWVVYSVTGVHRSEQ